MRDVTISVAKLIDGNFGGANLRDLPYIPAVEILRIKDTTLENEGRLKKVKSFARLAIKSFAITGNFYGQADHQMPA